MSLAEMPFGYRAIALRTAIPTPATHVNCYLVGTRRALVIDPGSPFPAELDRLRGALFSLRGSGGTLAGIFITHHHRDHCAGARHVAAQFDLPIIAHRETLSRLPIGARSTLVSTQEVTNGDTLAFDDDRTLQVLHTPGPTPGHCCLFESRRRVLLGGDVILANETTLFDPVDGDMRLYMASLAQLAQHDPAWVLPGHGPARPSGGQIARCLLERRRRRERQLLSHLDTHHDGRTALELAHCADGQRPPTLLSLMAAQRSTLAHLQKLASEGKVRRCSGGWKTSGRAA